MKTLIISSSLNPDSHSFLLCKKAQELLEEQGVQTQLIDLRGKDLRHSYQERSPDMQEIHDAIASADNLIFGLAVHCYSINDSLKSLIDTSFPESHHKFYGILCAAGGEKSYLATQHLTQILQNEQRMIQLPRVVYATKKDFEQGRIKNTNILDRLTLFTEEFIEIGQKLISST